MQLIDDMTSRLKLPYVDNYHRSDTHFTNQTHEAHRSHLKRLTLTSLEFDRRKISLVFPSTCLT